MSRTVQPISRLFGVLKNDGPAIPLKEDPEKILVRGKRAYIGHPHPFPDPTKGKKT